LMLQSILRIRRVCRNVQVHATEKLKFLWQKKWLKNKKLAARMSEKEDKRYAASQERSAAKAAGHLYKTTKSIEWKREEYKRRNSGIELLTEFLKEQHTTEKEQLEKYLAYEKARVAKVAKNVYTTIVTYKTSKKRKIKWAKRWLKKTEEAIPALEKYDDSTYVKNLKKDITSAKSTLFGLTKDQKYKQ